jgi:hypothetical protein
MHALGSSFGAHCRRKCSMASIPPSCGIFVYNDSTSKVNKVLSGRVSRDSIIEIILLVSFTKEGSCFANGLIKKSINLIKGPTASMPTTIGCPGGFVTFLCNFGKV